MVYTEMFLKEICRKGEYSFQYIDNILVLIPREDVCYYMPTIAIEDLDGLEEALKDYIFLIKSSRLQYYQINRNHRISDYLFYLVKSLTNEDTLDFVGYIRKVIAYIEDRTFNDYRTIRNIGKVGPYNLLARKCEEYYGAETPFTMHFYLEREGFRFELPLVRYGIDANKVAYIYSVQRKRLYVERVLKEVDTTLNGVNRGVKTDRNITPGMLCSLAAFMGMLRDEGITKVKADGFLTRRYGYLNGIFEDEERNRVFGNSVDKFFKLFQRLAVQSVGFDITAYPLDVDSYMHIDLKSDLSSSNEVLSAFYNKK